MSLHKEIYEAKSWFNRAWVASWTRIREDVSDVINDIGHLGTCILFRKFPAGEIYLARVVEYKETSLLRLHEILITCSWESTRSPKWIL